MASKAEIAESGLQHQTGCMSVMHAHEIGSASGTMLMGPVYQNGKAGMDASKLKINAPALHQHIFIACLMAV